MHDRKLDNPAALKQGKGKMLSLPPADECRLLTFTPAYDIDFVERLLGRSEGQQLPRATQARLDEVRDSLTDLIRPRVLYTVRRLVGLDTGMVHLECGTTLHSRKLAHALQGADRIVCFLATIGVKVDRRISDLMDNNRMANGYVAEALGSGAVEELADRFQTAIARGLAPRKRKVGLRFSPGYCDWPVTEQRKIFDIIDGRTIGVRLGKTSLMQPRKSISGVFGIYDGEKAPAIDANPCRRCGKKDCLARRTESQATQ